MNPARHGPEFSTGITFNIKSFPRRVTPSRLKRSYSEESVRRCPFGNENELGCGMWVAKNLGDVSTKEIFPRNPAEDFSRKESGRFIARETQQVFPSFQPAIQLSQPELRLQPAWSFQSLRAEAQWELELSPERRFRFFARTPREARHQPECRCISS
jgi:hypothetical protein